MSGSQFVNRSAQEHLLYIQEKVNPVLEALVTAVLLERPEDPSFFMLKSLCEQTKSLDSGGQQPGNGTPPEIDSVRAEINRLKERRAQLLAKKAGMPPAAKMEDAGPKAKPDSENESEEESDDDEDAPDMPDPAVMNMNRGPRQSVSAEAYGAWNVKAAFTAPVYEKTAEQKKRIRDCLEKSFLFCSLEAEEMDTLLLAMKEQVSPPETWILRQGEDGESMFLIEEGVAECFKRIADVETLVKTCGPGDVFGELALLYNCPRAASVQCKEQTTLWELDRATFSHIVQDSAQKKRDTYTDFLKKIPLFSNVDQYEIMTITDALKVEVFDREGVDIIKQGAVGDKFFLVVEGACIAKKAFVLGQEPRAVMTHKEGDYFGELALLENTPRAATVSTGSPAVKLLSMDRRTFKRLLGPVEDILRREAKRYDGVVLKAP